MNNVLKNGKVIHLNDVEMDMPANDKYTYFKGSHSTLTLNDVRKVADGAELKENEITNFEMFCAVTQLNSKYNSWRYAHKSASKAELTTRYEFYKATICTELVNAFKK